MRRLIIRPGAIGDSILALPAMESLRAGYTEVWVASQSVPLVRFADCVRGIASTGLDRIGIEGLEAPRLDGFDSIVSWYGTRRPEFREAVRELPFQFLPALPEDGAHMHAADFFLRQAGGGAFPAIPRIECPRGSGDYVAIHPFSGSAKKNWPLERYRELARRLPAPVRWTAGPEEALEDAVRFEDLYELACWLAGARLYIGNDSGITHLAAASGTPVLALFGPTDPAVWAPRGPQVRILTPESAGAPVDEIPLEAVLAAASRMLESGTGVRTIHLQSNAQVE
ncbi:MAG TPA: glycosyltransferase family 9 protein [Bryobacteraceae bacterium]